MGTRAGDPVSGAERLVELALDLGFDLAAVAPLEPPPDAERFAGWLEAGYAADMDWLARQRGRIMDPRGLAHGPASLLIVGLAHGRPGLETPDGTRLARYAAGRDYHNRMTKLLRKLRKRITAESGLPAPGRTFADAAPLLERSHATAAGLGFPSKAANLLHPRFGPWFFLGELVIEAPLEVAPSPPAGSCGTCTACLDACPTGALRSPGVLDAELCISYQTIENRGPIPHQLRNAVAEWGFGCDVCSEVCPWGDKAPDTSQAWGTHPEVAAALEAGVGAWLGPAGSLDRGAAHYKERWRGSAMQRAQRDGLARNAALALGLTRPDGAQRWLTAALEADPAPLVREAAAWGLARGFGGTPGVRDTLAAALEREPDPAWRALLARDLELADA